ncbi:S9 family peptidase [Peredibacter starrii]|uniref:S9 family peptidase n=1 Tax=Peredibacter starrii TaxID=28202 RepID=A0AAX4HL62_9BACT|nr:S9 family peptidase [Peredibacter starrii]WPU63873.1 S9 family peptidase [Peredibacter starrii]
MNKNSGEAHQLTHLKGNITAFEWGPEGDVIYATSIVELEERPEDISPAEWRNRPKVINIQRYKSDNGGFLLQKHTHLFKIDVETGSATQLTNGEFDVTSLAVSPDGKSLCFCRSRTGDDSFKSDLWSINLDTNAQEQMTYDIPSAMTPNWSPDSKWLVVVGSTEPGRSIMWPWLVNAKNKEILKIGDGEAEVSTFPLASSSPVFWLNDSKAFYFTLARNGLSEVAKVDIDNCDIEVIISGERQISLLRGNSEILAYLSTSIDEPGDIYISPLDGSSEKRLTELNADWWKKKSVPNVEKKIFEVGKGKKVEGWLMTPQEANGKLPLLIDAHGGPHSMVEFGFSYHVYWYLLASRGWAVLALNPEGSGSHGLGFAEELRGRWGEKDFSQYMEAIKILQDENIIDDRLAIAGKSYGGFMSAWAIGHSDDFKAAIVSAPVVNLESHYGTSDSGFYVDEFDMDADINHYREIFREHSPITYAANVKTPTLILQGEEDQRCPVGQSEEFFSSIAKNCPAELILYPEEHHDLAEAGKLSHRVDYHQRIADWCDKWVNKGGHYV